MREVNYTPEEKHRRLVKKLEFRNNCFIFGVTSCICVGLIAFIKLLCHKNGQE